MIFGNFCGTEVPQFPATVTVCYESINVDVVEVVVQVDDEGIDQGLIRYKRLAKSNFSFISQLHGSIGACYYKNVFCTRRQNKTN